MISIIRKGNRLSNRSSQQMNCRLRTVWYMDIAALFEALTNKSTKYPSCLQFKKQNQWWWAALSLYIVCTMCGQIKAL